MRLIWLAPKVKQAFVLDIAKMGVTQLRTEHIYFLSKSKYYALLMVSMSLCYFFSLKHVVFHIIMYSIELSKDNDNCYWFRPLDKCITKAYVLGTSKDRLSETNVKNDE